MMNQMYGSGPRGNRGGRGHYQPGRYHHNRYPHPNFKNPNFHQNNNNTPKCYNQNIDHCPNPNMEHGEFLPPNDRLFANTGGNSTYLGNDAAYQLEPMYHGHGPPVVYDMPQYGQPHFPDINVPPPMVPQMQMVNYPSPAYMPSNLVYNVFSQSGMPPPQPEPFNTMKDMPSLTQSRESFSGQETDVIDCHPIVPNDYAPPQTPNCASCAGNEARSATTIRELQTDIGTLRSKNQALLEENELLKVELQGALSKKEEPAVSTEYKTGLSVNAEPFVAKPSAVYESCTAGGGQKWPPDPVDQGYEKTCTELIEIIEDKPEEAWVPPVSAPVLVPVPLPLEIPVVSANGTKWSEMLETEVDAAPDSPLDYKSRGRVCLEDRGRQSAPHELPQGRGQGYHDNPAARGHGYHENPAIPSLGYQNNRGPNPSSNDQGTGRGAMRKTDNRSHAGQQQHHQNRGLNSYQPPDRAGDFQNMRTSMGNSGNRGGRTYRNDQRQYGVAPRHNNSKDWRERPVESRDGEPSNAAAGLVAKRDDVKREVKAEVLVDERKVDALRLEDQKGERPNEREESQERPKGGSGDRLRSQAATVNDTRKSKKTKRKKK